MTANHRVIWSQGMFLQPQHFQQESRFLEHLLNTRAAALDPFGWGFGSLVLDEAGLATGRVALARAAGVLPDGTTFSIPDADPPPSPLRIDPDMHDERVCLAATRARTGVTEVDYGADPAPSMARYAVTDREVRDQTRASDDPEIVQLGAIRLSLLREREVTDAHAALGVVRVVERRPDGQVVLDRGYIAPQTRIDASGQLSTVATLLHGLVQQRAHTLAGAMGQLGQGVSEVADFLMLLVLNRAEPILQQFAALPSVHPRAFHLACLQLAGELATFSSDERHPREYTPYLHEDLQSSFTALVDDLREYLSAVIQRHAEQIELVDRGHGVRTAVVTDAEMLRQAGFVLAVRSQMPADQLRTRFPAQSKLGPVDRIKDLVNLALPGIPLRGLAVAPRQLPYHSGSHYFEVERGGDLWKLVERSGAMALFVGGDFPGLELELWALRRS